MTPHTPTPKVELALQLGEARQSGDWEGAYRIRTQMFDALRAEHAEAIALLREVAEFFPEGRTWGGVNHPIGVKARALLLKVTA